MEEYIKRKYIFESSIKKAWEKIDWGIELVVLFILACNAIPYIYLLTSSRWAEELSGIWIVVIAGILLAYNISLWFALRRACYLKEWSREIIEDFRRYKQHNTGHIVDTEGDEVFDVAIELDEEIVDINKATEKFRSMIMMSGMLFFVPHYILLSIFLCSYQHKMNGLPHKGGYYLLPDEDTRRKYYPINKDKE